MLLILYKSLIDYIKNLFKFKFKFTQQFFSYI